MTKSQFSLVSGGKVNAGGSGAGPEDPALHRVERLENLLASLEPKISEILLAGARQADLHRLEVKFSETARQTDLMSVRVDLAEIKGRLSMLPTWWMLILALIATWGAGTGIVFALLRFAAK